MANFETIRDAQNDLVRANLHFAILFDSMTNAAVSTLEAASTGDLEIPATAESAGIIEKGAGVSLTHDIESTDIEGYGDSEPVRTIISKRTIQFNADFLETNKAVLEKFWGLDFAKGGFEVSDKGGVTITAPNLPKNIFYRAYLVASDDVDGDDLYAYYIMPRVKLVNVDSQDSKDDGAFSYKMTFMAYRDSTAGFTVIQGWCGPGWLRLLDKTGFVTPPASLTVTSTLSVTAANGASHTGQIVVTGSNGINYTPVCTYVSGTPAKATVSPTGLVTGVAAGTSTVTVTYAKADGSGNLTGTCSVTVT